MSGKSKEAVLVILDPPPKELRPNTPTHYRPKAVATKRFRAHAGEETMVACYQYKVKRPLTTAIIGITFYFPTKAFQDRDNILASLKAGFDGMVDGGLFTDDRELFHLPVVRRKDAEDPRVELRVWRKLPKKFRKLFADLQSK